MTLHVRTAQRNRYRGPDRLDITRQYGGEAGAPFAPSWAILKPAIEARHLAKEVRARGDALSIKAADLIEEQAWAIYRPLFLEEARVSFFRDHREAWRELLSRDQVTLVCACPTRERCHRGLVVYALKQLGAVDEGEVRS